MSLEALVRDPNGPTVIIEDPRTSSPGLGLLLWMKSVFGDGAADAWAAMAPRIVTVTRGWSEAYGLFLDGEADMVLSYTTSPAYHTIAEGDPSTAPRSSPRAMKCRSRSPAWSPAPTSPTSRAGSSPS